MSIASMTMHGFQAEASGQRDEARRKATRSARRTRMVITLAFGALMVGTVVNATWLQTEHIPARVDVAAASSEPARPSAPAVPVVQAMAVVAPPVTQKIDPPVLDMLPVGSIPKAATTLKTAARHHGVRPVARGTGMTPRKTDAITAFLSTGSLKPASRP